MQRFMKLDYRQFVWDGKNGSSRSIRDRNFYKIRRKSRREANYNLEP